MEYVEPIRNVKKIAQIKNLLRGQQRFRDLLLFVFGINTALRASDLLALQAGQVVDATDEIVSSFIVREQKTGKRHDVTINESMHSTLVEYRAAYPQALSDPGNCLFFSLKPLSYSRAITRWQAWEFMTTICKEVGLAGHYGTHTLRKTWGYHARLNGVELGLIMHKLNHSSFTETKRYLGITDDELQAAVKRLNL